ncbi:calcium-binding protein [Synechococcus sp. MIT S1220]|uniref:calcium-binding protein n=1 Tax=Synechococcus sp. MIT S1220 TaxID=3082549 RepID=UPI0039AEA492
MAYSTVQGVYRFDADGDWFTFSGNIDSYDGGGALKTDVWYAPEQLGLDSWDDHDSNDLIKFSSVSNNFGYGYSDLIIESYHDSYSGQTFDAIYNNYGTSLDYLSAELKAGGMIYEVGPQYRTFNSIPSGNGEASLADTIAFDSPFDELSGNNGTGGTVINIINNGGGDIAVGDIIVNSLKGTISSDVLSGIAGDKFEDDVIDGLGGDDVLTGYRGADQLNGGDGNDEVRAGNGRDVLTGGEGGDDLYGGFGQNTFTGEQDGAEDWLFLKSDHLAVNYLNGKAGNNVENKKADVIASLDSFDQIFIQGASDSQLSFKSTTHTTISGESLSGIGIYASNSLEAIYTGDNLTINQLSEMTIGVAA